VKGRASPWIKNWMNEEIAAHSLEGSALDAGQDILAIVVEGQSGDINRLYEKLRKTSPMELQYTSIEFGTYDVKKQQAKKSEIDLGMIYELLKEIEKNTRRINQKIDRALAQGGGIVEKTEPQKSLYGWGSGESTSMEHEDSSSTGYGWNSSETEEKEKEEEVAGGFASMFE